MWCLYVGENGDSQNRCNNLDEDDTNQNNFARKG